MTTDEIRAIEADAIAYLREHLRERTPERLAFEGAFNEAALDGEGTTALFSFHLPPMPGAVAAGCGDPASARHYVAVGRTAPNFFPAYGLSPDDAYSFHLGTRFMLEMQIQRVDDSLEPPDARPQMRAFVDTYARGAVLRGESLAALFKCADGYFAVYRLTLDDDEVYCMGGDCPAGFCRMAEHPPQAALRLHLGAIIRHEARAAAAPEPSAP